MKNFIFFSNSDSKPRSDFLPSEFYKKWLIGLADDLHSPSMENTPRTNAKLSTIHLSTRHASSKMTPTRKMSTRNISSSSGSNRPRNSGGAAPSRLSLNTPQNSIGLASQGTEDGTSKTIVRRKLLDSKSELKQIIFGFHQKQHGLIVHLFCIFCFFVHLYYSNLYFFGILREYFT